MNLIPSQEEALYFYGIERYNIGQIKGMAMTVADGLVPFDRAWEKIMADRALASLTTESEFREMVESMADEKTEETVKAMTHTECDNHTAFNQGDHSDPVVSDYTAWRKSKDSPFRDKTVPEINTAAVEYSKEHG